MVQDVHKYDFLCISQRVFLSFCYTLSLWGKFKIVQVLAYLMKNKMSNTYFTIVGKLSCSTGGSNTVVWDFTC